MFFDFIELKKCVRVLLLKDLPLPTLQRWSHNSQVDLASSRAGSASLQVDPASSQVNGIEKTQNVGTESSQNISTVSSQNVSIESSQNVGIGSPQFVGTESSQNIVVRRKPA